MRRIISKLFKLVSRIKQSRGKEYIPAGLFNLLKVYNYHFWLVFNIWSQDCGYDPIRTVKTLLGNRKRILFHPDVPWESSMMFQICLILRYAISNNAYRSFDLAVHWKSTTYSEPNAILAGLAKERTVVNFRCNDISKSRVNRIFEEVFGYTASVDPLTYKGKCVRKSNLNALHDGKVIDCPIAEADDRSIYQILIDNETDNGSIMDLRVPIVKQTIPFVFLYFRPVEVRFGSEIKNIKTAGTREIFTEEEQINIIQFCDQLGLDYGELDVLRNKTDGKIYIIDANTTPHGPPIHLGSRRQGLRRLAMAFADRFLEQDHPSAIR